MRKGVLFLSAFLIILASCKKDEHRSLRESGIVKGSWKVRARDTFNSVSPDSVGYDTLNNLERVTRYRFFPDGNMARISTFQLDTLVVSDSAVTGKWILRDADTRITLTDPKLAGDYRFISYNDSLMKLIMVATNGDSDSSVITTVLRRL